MLDEIHAKNTIEVLTRYLLTAEHIQQQGLTDRLDMSHWDSMVEEDDTEPDCQTTHCMMGWQVTLGLAPYTIDNQYYIGRVCEEISWADARELEHHMDRAAKQEDERFRNAAGDHHAWKMFYGTHNGTGPQALRKLVRRATLRLFQAERYLFWLEQQRLPKRMRADHAPVQEVA